MERILNIDSLKKSIVKGCNKFIFDPKYVSKFFEINYIDLDEDSVNFFKNKTYSDSHIFQIVFSNYLTKNYSNINSDLLIILKDLATCDDKTYVATLIAYTCLEPIDKNLNVETFVNKFSAMKYFLENQFSTEKNKPQLNIKNYCDLANHKNLFYINDELFKSREEISAIIEDINQYTPIIETIDQETNTKYNNFNEACINYENVVLNSNHKKM